MACDKCRRRHQKCKCPKRKEKTSRKKCYETYDYIIAGCGTGGSILASKLSDPNKFGKFKYSVLVLELGLNLTQDPNVLANNLFDAASFAGSPYYSRNTPAFSFQGTPIDQSEGTMWGGSSGHNGLQGYRATPDVYNRWAAISGNPRWSYNNLLNNVMKPMEHYTPDNTIPNPAQRGFNGNLFITQSPSVAFDPASQILASVSQAGLVSDLNDIDALTNGQVGVGADQVTATPLLTDPNSVRSFGGNSFLTGIPSQGIPAVVDENGKGLNGRKLTIKSNSYVTKVIISKKNGQNRAKGVEYVKSNERSKTLVAKARKGVISCLGAIYTPVLFQLSGIGDAEILNQAGVPVISDNKNVGAHLANHTGGLAFINDLPSFIFPPSIGNAFVGVNDPNIRDTQVLYANGAILQFFAPQCVRTFVNLPNPLESSGYLGLDVAPRSEGNVRIVSSDPFRQPEVSFNNYSDGGPSDPGSDANKMVKFYKLIQQMATVTGKTVAYPTPEMYAAGDDALFNAALITAIYAYHQSNSCRMGTSKENGVVDGNLEVFDVKGLYVGDNSAAPVISDCNTALQAYIIGAELARILRGE